MESGYASFAAALALDLMLFLLALIMPFWAFFLSFSYIFCWRSASSCSERLLRSSSRSLDMLTPVRSSYYPDVVGCAVKSMAISCPLADIT